jgi:hypothetical protein
VRTSTYFEPLSVSRGRGSTPLAAEHPALMTLLKTFESRKSQTGNLEGHNFTTTTYLHIFDGARMSNSHEYSSIS